MKTQPSPHHTSGESPLVALLGAYHMLHVTSFHKESPERRNEDAGHKTNYQGFRPAKASYHKTGWAQ